MERIEFKYVFEDGTTDKRIIKDTRTDKDECGLRSENICEMFEEFMRAIGFSESSVWSYFHPHEGNWCN